MTALPGVSPPPGSDPGCGGGGTGTGSGAGSAWDVYCDGPLLEAVQSSGLFEDSKTFVDMPMKQASHGGVLYVRDWGWVWGWDKKQL